MEITIKGRFCGPPGSANGGYCCGVLAASFGAAEGPVQVRLRRPVPLDRPLRVSASAGASAELWHGDELVAEALAVERLVLDRLVLELPAPPTFAEAAAMSARYAGFERHPYPGCFVCGPQRSVGDGLRIFAGPGAEGKTVAAPWKPDRSLGDARGQVQPPYLWAALDCPGYFAVQGRAQRALLGTMTAELRAPVRAGEPCVVLGWPLQQEGRKLHAATALWAEDGKVRGVARQVWIAVD